MTSCDLVTMGDVQEVDCDLTKEQVAELKQAFDMFDRLVVLLKLVLRVANNQCPSILNSILIQKVLRTYFITLYIHVV